MSPRKKVRCTLALKLLTTSSTGKGKHTYMYIFHAFGANGGTIYHCSALFSYRLKCRPQPKDLMMHNHLNEAVMYSCYLLLTSCSKQKHDIISCYVGLNLQFR